MIPIAAFRKALTLPWSSRRLAFVVSFGLMTYCFVRLVNDVISETKFWLRPVRTNIAELLGVVLISFVFEWVVRSFLLEAEESPGSEAAKPWKKFLLLAACLEVVVVSLIFPLAALTDDGIQWYDVIILTFVPLSCWLIYFYIRLSQVLGQKAHRQQLLVEQIRKDRLETELENLRAQFHPHFLFNALNTVYFQVEESNQAARQTIEQLAALLRYQLYDQDRKVPLQEEFTHLDNYIALQRQRVSERLRLELAWPASANGATIYPLLMLPLVENAFKYCGGEWWIRIGGKLDGETLELRVENSLPPMTAPQQQGGIGLVNLSKRLELLYPGRYHLETARLENYFIATLQITL